MLGPNPRWEQDLERDRSFLPADFPSVGFPKLEATELARLAQFLKSRGLDALQPIPIVERMEAWERTVTVLLDPESRARQRLLPRLLTSSGLSPAGLVEGLEVLLGGLRGQPLRKLVARFPPLGQVHRNAPFFAGVNLAANLPGLGAQVVLPALLAGVPLLIRSSEREPFFVPTLLEVLAKELPEAGEAYAAVTFPHEKGELAEAAWSQAERLLAFGSRASIAACERRFGRRVLGFGPKLSIALVTEPFDSVSVARQLARDVSLFDQRGCLSVQAVFCAASTTRVQELAEALAWGLELEALRLPPGPPQREMLVGVQQLRLTARARGLWLARLPIEVGTVILETEFALYPSPGMRSVTVSRLEHAQALLPVLEPWRGQLQGVALQGAAAWELREDLEKLGFSRFAAPGQLQHTDATWENGGVSPVALFH